MNLAQLIDAEAEQLVVFMALPGGGGCYISCVGPACFGIDLSSMSSTPSEEFIQIDDDANELEPALLELLKPLRNIGGPLFIRRRQLGAVNAVRQEPGVVLPGDPENAVGLGLAHGGNDSAS